MTERGLGAGAIRAFVGVPLAERLAADYAAVQRELGSLSGVKWVEPRNLHLTLKFLGQVDREAVPALSECLLRAAAAGEGVTLAASRLTAFPSERAARILVVELAEPTGSLLRVQQAIERELAGIGIAPEERPFRMHLTLGRVRRSDVDARAAMAAALPPPGEWRVESFDLIESRLGPRGPTYVPLRSFRFG